MRAEVQAVRRARQRIEAVRQRLRCPTPQSVSDCAGPLLQAIRSMESVEQDLRGTPHSAHPQLWTELAQLRKELSDVSVLLRGAAAFYEGWGVLLRSQEDLGTDYARGGKPLMEPNRRGLFIHG